MINSFEEKSYNGNVYRPRPEIHRENDGTLLIVSTPWGSRSSARRANQMIVDYFLSTRQDREATSPFNRLGILSPLANDLRIAVRLANDLIYNEENKQEYKAGIELFVLAKTESEVAWVQIGHPYPILIRPNNSLVILGSQQDLSLDHSPDSKAFSPLPNKLLGIDRTSDFSSETIRRNSNDRLLLISRSVPPLEIFRQETKKLNFNSMATSLSNENPEVPFWMGLIEL